MHSHWGDSWGNSWNPSWNFPSGPHPVGKLTRFGLEGYGVRRAGSFAGKTGSTPPPTPPPPEVPAVIPSGGIPATLRLPHRGRKELSRERERFGIQDAYALRVIAQVAAAQAERLELDKQKQFEELSRELKLKRLEWKGQYLEALAFERERLIDAEIKRRFIDLRIKQLRDEQDILILMAMIATLA